MCKHDEWMKLCVLCGEVLETTENKSSVVASAEMNKTVYVAAQPSKEWWACSCGYAMPEPLQSCVKCGTPNASR